MDTDASSKFISSLTKFLQSLCNGYVEFQKGVELVGHIYLNIDTGEKVDYILHEKVSKSDENSVTFISNSFHAQNPDKDCVPPKKDDASKLASNSDDDVMIVDQSNSKGMPGSTNSGTVLSRNMLSTSEQRQFGGKRSHSSSFPLSHQNNRQLSGGPSSTVTSQETSQENINMGNVKLEQISSEELLSLASQVDDGTSSSHAPHKQGHQGGPLHSSRGFSDKAGQPVWIKQEPADVQGGPDTGWSQSGDVHSDSSNSSSNLYPVMVHQNPAYSAPVFPGFPSTSSSSVSGSQHRGFSQSLPGTPNTANPYASRLAGSSHMDPAVSLQSSDETIWQYLYKSRKFGAARGGLSVAEAWRLYRARLRHTDPEKYLLNKRKNALRMRKKREELKKRLENEREERDCMVPQGKSENDDGQI